MTLGMYTLLLEHFMFENNCRKKARILKTKALFLVFNIGTCAVSCTIFLTHTHMNFVPFVDRLKTLHNLFSFKNVICPFFRDFKILLT